MKKTHFFAILTAMLLMVTGTMAQKAMKSQPTKLNGIWQLCHYVSDTPDTSGVLKPTSTFKVLSDDGRIVNFTLVPGSDAIITGYGTYKQINANSYKESIIKNIHLPEFDNRDNIIEFELINGDQLNLKYYIQKDKDGNELNSWYHETWKLLKMPDKFPEDLVR